MSDPKSGLQFERMEGAAPAAPAACGACQRTIPDVYFEHAGQVFCAPCKDAALTALAGGSRIGRMLKALALGSVAAAVCAVGWFAIVKLTGYELGIVAIVVGIVVGGAVRLGSEGRGGWPYQIAAVLLTYLSIGASYVPLVMEAMREGVESGAFEEAAAEPGAGAEGAAAEEPMTPEDREVALIIGSVVLGLTLPVLQVTEGGFMGLLIVCFALFQAFKMNTRRSLAFSGPFQIGSAARAGSA